MNSDRKVGLDDSSFSETAERNYRDGHRHAAEQKRELAAMIRRQGCLLYTSPSPRDLSTSRMPSSA